MPLRLSSEKWAWLRGPLFWVELFAIGNIGVPRAGRRRRPRDQRLRPQGRIRPRRFLACRRPAAGSAMRSAVRCRPLADSGPRPRLPGGRGRPGRSAYWSARVRFGVGLAGLLFHLDSVFFEEQTLRNLVYTAPFAAPLAYTGLGFLVLLSRMVDADDPEWAGWVVVLAAGGWAGNFVLTLADHAQNGFFHPTEWIGVVASTSCVWVPDRRGGRARQSPATVDDSGRPGRPVGRRPSRLLSPCAGEPRQAVRLGLGVVPVRRRRRSRRCCSTTWRSWGFSASGRRREPIPTPTPHDRRAAVA